MQIALQRPAGKEIRLHGVKGDPLLLLPFSAKADGILLFLFKGVFKNKAAILNGKIVVQRKPGMIIRVIVKNAYDTQFVFLVLQKLPADVPGADKNGGLLADFHHRRAAHKAHMSITHGIILLLALKYHTGSVMSSKRKKCLPIPAGIFMK
jgi:hypothetical protein